MDIKKEREAFEQCYIANHHDGDIHPNQQLLEWSEKGEFYFAISVNDLWDMWLVAKQQAVPDGFVVVNKGDLARVLNCVTDDWLVDTNSMDEFNKIESLVLDEVESLIQETQK